MLLGHQRTMKDVLESGAGREPKPAAARAIHNTQVRIVDMSVYNQHVNFKHSDAGAVNSS